MKKLLSVVLITAMLASLCVLCVSAENDFVNTFFPENKITTPQTAPYLKYESTYEDGTYHDSFIHLYYDVPADFCKMAEEADRTGWEAFLERYGLEFLQAEIQVDAKFDDGEWLSTTGNWDVFEYSEDVTNWNLAFYLRYTRYCDDSAKTGDFEQSWLTYVDPEQQCNAFLLPYIKQEKNDGGDNVWVYDFENHTITYRYRVALAYRPTDYEGDLDYSEGNVILSDWSSEASIGKNGSQRELVRPTSTAAPILSDFVIDEDNEGIIGASYFLEVPHSVADGERALIILEDAFQPYCIEAEVRLEGGEWMDFYTANASDISNGTRSLALGDYDVTRETRIEIRAHFVCYHDESITSPWSNIVGINRTVEDLFWGDVNDDGKVNTKDVSLFLKCSAGYQLTMNEAAGDVNCDGKLNTKDVSLILKYLAGWKVTLGPAE